MAKAVFEEIFKTMWTPKRYVEEKGLKVVNDEGRCATAVEAVLAANPAVH